MMPVMDSTMTDKLITRRSILRGLFACPAIVAASSLMPVRGVVMAIEPEYVGIHFQTWPLNEIAPEWFSEGSFASIDGTIKPLSHWMNRLEEFRAIYPVIHWRPLHSTP